MLRLAIALRACGALALFLASWGCASVPQATRIEGVEALQLVPALQAGNSREAVVLELGTPARELESGRILCFLLRRDAERGTLVPVPRNVTPFESDQLSWRWVEYDLVTVFDADGLLERFSLVQLW